MKIELKYPLCPLGRYVLHEVHRGVCWLCGTYVELANMEADHVIPRAARQVMSQFQLPPEFDLDGIENLMPSHGWCNARKSKKVNFLMVDGLAKARQYSDTVRSRVRKIIESLSDSRISHQIEIGQLAEGDREILRRALRQADEREYQSSLDQRWTNVRRLSEGLVEASGPLGRGVAAVGRTRVSEYLCPSCGGYGPWEGAKCCMCGYHGMPDD
jgi:hypothetical protein